MTKNKHISSQIYGQPWLITADGLDTVCMVADREGSVEAVLAKIGDRPENTQRVQVRGSVAVIDVNGPILRFANVFSEISGATSIQSFATDFQAALDNPNVSAIIPYFGTPGGQAAGINETANMIREGAKIKPVVGYVHDQAASAGFWLAAACSELVIDKTAMLGSVGVVIGIQDKDGGRTIEFISDVSPKKRLDPTTEAGKEAYTEISNSIATVFVDSVASFRGVSVEKVIADFGQGGLLVGDDAVAAGMADRTGSLEGLIEELNSNTYLPPAARAGNNAASAAQTKVEVSQMNKKELLAKYPVECQALIDDGKATGKEEMRAGTDVLITSATGEGAKAESARLLGLLAVHAGEESATAFGKIAASGVDAEQFKAIRGDFKPEASADEKFKTEMLANIQKYGAENVGANGEILNKPKGFEAQVADHMAANSGCKKGAAMTAVQAIDPAAHATWLAAQQV